MWLFFQLLFVWIAVKSDGISLTSQSIDVAIKDRYAFITYSFSFSNTDSTASSDLSYQIQLEPKIFISYFYAELNGLIFRGETKEKSEAQHEYNAAVESGTDAVLISQDHDANVFNVQTNIAANGVAVLNITAEQFMLRRFGYYELALTVTNEYDNSIINELFSSTPITTSITDESGISYTDVIVPTNANYNTQQESSSRYNLDITVDRRTADANAQQLLMRYKTATMTAGHNQYMFDSESLTFLHIFSYEDEAILPRRVVFVLDRSGSMGTSKWNKAVSATKGAINNLKPGIDRMNIILFDDTMNTYASSMVSVTASVIEASKTWIDGYTSGGSTDIHQAVIDALALIQNDMNAAKPYAYVNQVILITDGEPTSGVTDPTQIQTGIMNANAQLEPAQAAIFCLGIGNDYGTSWVNSLNYPMLRGIATQNDGFDARVKESETETILSEYYDILESPVLAYISLDYSNIDASTLSRHKFRCLYSGTDIVVAAKLAAETVSDVDVTLLAFTSGEAVVEKVNVAIDWSDVDSYVAERIWAYLKLLTFRRTLDNPLLAALLQTQGETAALALALQHELVTPWTSMIAVAYRDEMTVNVTENNDDEGGDMGDMEEMEDMSYSMPISPSYTSTTSSTSTSMATKSTDNKMGSVPVSVDSYYDDDAFGDDDDDDADQEVDQVWGMSDNGKEHNNPVLYVVIVVIAIGFVIGMMSYLFKRKQQKKGRAFFTAEIGDDEDDHDEEEATPQDTEMIPTPIDDKQSSLLPTEQL